MRRNKLLSQSEREIVNMANVEITLNQTVSGVEIVNVMSWQTPDTDAGTLQALVDGIRGRFNADVADSFASTWFLNTASVRIFDGGAPFTTEFAFGLGPLQGTSAVEALPRQSALLVSLTYTGPRPNRGRQFYGGLAENSWDGDAWDAGTIADFQNMWGQFILGLVTPNGTCFPRIARKNYLTNTWDLDNPVENAIVRPYARTQKGRRS